TGSSNNQIAGWFTSNPTITLSAADALSGLNVVRYNWDSIATSSIGTIFTNGITVNIIGQGVHTLYLYISDIAGNSIAPTGVYRLDTVNPVVSATGSSASWQNSLPSMVVTGSDTLPGSGVSSIQYGWDSAAS